MSEKVDNIVPPKLLNGVKNLQQIAVTGSSQVDAIDSQLRNRWVRVKTSVAIAFYFREDNAGTVDQTLATDQASTSATLGYQMAAGAYEDFLLDGKCNYIVHQGTGAGYLQLLGSGTLRNGVDGP